VLVVAKASSPRLTGRGLAPLSDSPLERLQGGLFFIVYGKELVEFRYLEYFANLRVDISEDQPASDLLDFRVQGD